MKKILFTLLFVIFSAHFALANIMPSDTLNTIRWYKVYWGGIHIADFRAKLKDDRLDTVIESYGIVRKISKYSSKGHTIFDFNDGQYVPISHYVEFRQRHGDRKIDIKYTNQGKILQEAVTPPDNRAKRPAVNDTLKRNTVDPFTAIMVARKKIKDSMAKGEKEFSFDVYDGRRLVRLDFQIHGKSVRKINKVTHDIVKVTFKRHPVEGFTKNELRRMKGEEPMITLYLSDDEELLPIKVDADAPLGTAVLLLEKECFSMEECV